MRVDVATPDQLKLLEDMVRAMMGTMSNDILILRNFVMELQDRIKMLEDKK